MGSNNEDVWEDKPAEHEDPGVAEAHRVLRQEVHRAGVEIALGGILIIGEPHQTERSPRRHIYSSHREAGSPA